MSILVIKKIMMVLTIILLVLILNPLIHSSESEYLFETNNCTISYVILDEWNSGATINVAITNNDISAIRGWSLTWTFPGDQQITNLWEGNYNQNANFVTVTNLSHNEIIPANGGTIVLGFNISYNNANGIPNNFNLNIFRDGIQIPDTTIYVLEGNDFSVSYDIRDDWGTGATVDMVIRNNNSIDINTWSLSWVFPGNQQITNFWCGNYTQNGNSITVTNLDYNAVISADGGSVSFGFNLSYNIENKRPTDFILNGTSTLNSSTTIEQGGISLSIPDGVTQGSTYISITPLNSFQMYILPDNTPNLILSNDNTVGYDVILNDNSEEEFLKDIYVSMKYDHLKLPVNVTEESIFIYYYDEFFEEWRHLNRENLDTQNKIVTCSTNHFCQMFVGAMVLSSESPQTEGLNINPVNIEKIGPMPGIKFINPPTPNNLGTANLSFSFTAPEGINHLTPSIGINYSSAATDGNSGYGWNLSMSSIYIDTKNGVPKYDGTDTLQLDGKELYYVGNNAYRYKVEESFARIVWDPTNQGFIVYEINGNKKYYGSNENSRLADPNNPSRIFSWSLYKVVDKYGNELTYEYKSRWDGFFHHNIYLNKITYGFNNLYTINFVWEELPLNYNRLSGRSGFLILNNEQLKQINIKYNNTDTLKIYDLLYTTMLYNKSFLTTIIEKAGNGINELNRTSFEYDTTIDNWFSNTNVWTAPVMNASGQEDLRYAENSSDYANHTVIDLVDINGDGMADRVYKLRYDNNFRVQYNTGYNFTNTQIINAPVFNIRYDDLRYTYSYDNRSHTEIDFIDINGDGRPDRIAKHRDDDNFYVQYNMNGGFTSTRYIITPFFDVQGEQDLRYTFIDHDGTRNHTEIDFVDFNGDGKPDRVAKHRNDNNIYVQLNSGYSFINLPPVPVIDGNMGAFGEQDLRFTYHNDNSNHTEIDFVDFNGDGLPDRVAKHRNDPNFYVQFNLGSSFTNTLLIPTSSLTGYGVDDIRYTYLDDDDKRSHTEVDFIDINGDGRPDRVAKHRNSDYIIVQLNTGTGFTQNIGIPVSRMNVPGDEDLRYTYDDGTNQHVEINFTDINGDGLPDRVAKHRNDPNFYIQFNQLSDKALLTKVIMTTGAEINLDYQQIYTDPNRNYNNNYRKQTVLSSISSGHPNILMNTATISYENAIYDLIEREFRGFKTVYASSADTEQPIISYVTKTTYMVDNITGQKDLAQNDLYDHYIKGQVESVTQMVYKLQGYNLTICNMGKVKNEYEKTDIIYGNTYVKFVYLARRRSWIYNPNMDSNYFMGRDETNGDLVEEHSYEYDRDLGLITKSITNEYHDPYHPYDDIQSITDMSLDISTTKWRCFPYKTEKKKLYGDQRIFLKTLTFNIKGSVASETIWNNFGTDSTTTYGYDYLGNIRIIEGQDGSTIDTITYYLPRENIYMEKVTRLPQKGLTETIRYDKYGRVVEKVNSFNEVNYISYDSLGRVALIRETVNGNLVITRSFGYRKATGYDGRTYYGVVIRNLNNLDTNDYIAIQYFKDALGREVQVKTETVVNGNKFWLVSGYTEHDSMGRIIKRGSSFIAPYSELDISLIPFQLIEPVTIYNYDELGRQYETNNPAGLVITNTYETITDSELGYSRILFKTTNSVKNRFGNYVQIGSTYQDMLGQNVRSKISKGNGTWLTTNSGCPITPKKLQLCH